MCSCTINTDVLLENLFVKINVGERVSLQTLYSYLNFLSDNFPVYVISDLSASNVKKCAEEYPELYRIEEDNGKVFVIRGELYPNLSFFYSTYSHTISSYIERITGSFLKEYRLECDRFCAKS